MVLMLSPRFASLSQGISFHEKQKILHNLLDLDADIAVLSPPAHTTAVTAPSTAIETLRRFSAMLQKMHLVQGSKRQPT